jgi:hypothetical protein
VGAKEKIGQSTRKIMIQGIPFHQLKVESKYGDSRTSWLCLILPSIFIFQDLLQGVMIDKFCKFNLKL